MSIFHDIEQNTEEWFELRRGKFTASMFSDLMMSETTATYKKAIYQILFERRYGKTPSDKAYSNKAMEWGKELEPYARQWYEQNNFIKVQSGGFVEYDGWVGCSPDGLVGDDGLIEIKSVYYNTFIDYKINGQLPTDYKYQVHGQLWITGRQWCDFIGYHPDVEDSNFVVRVYPDTAIINSIIDAINKAKDKINVLLKIL